MRSPTVFEELAALVQSEEDKQDAFEAIRGLVDRIVLSPERGKLRVDLHGEIAAIILRLAQAGKTPRPRPRGQG
jgi:hypothetical protein